MREREREKERQKRRSECAYAQVCMLWDRRQDALAGFFFHCLVKELVVTKAISLNVVERS